MKLNLKDYAWNEMEEGFVLYSIKDDAYFALNTVATDIWNFMFINEDVSKAEIINYIQGKYIGEESHIIQDEIAEFVEQLIAENIIIVE